MYEEIDNKLEGLIKGIISGIISLVTHDKDFRHWKKNFDYMQDCLKKQNSLFHIKKDIGSVAYVAGKGEENVITVSHKGKYVMTRDEIIVVICHEIAHLSVKDYRHTKLFHELNSVILFAAYLLYRIDPTNIKNKEIGGTQFVLNILERGKAYIVTRNKDTLYKKISFK